MAKLIFSYFAICLLSFSLAIGDNEWTYDKQNNWKYTCRDGMQSPININSPYNKKVNITLDDLSFEYCEVDNTYFKHTGNNLKLFGDFGKLKFNGKYYIASEITFLKTSEHTFGANNRTIDLEIQILHEDLHGKLLIVVVTYKLDNSNSIFMNQLEFSQVKGMMKGDTKNIKNNIDVGLIFNKVTDYVYYKGSLTRPPCALDVEYLIIASQKQISQEYLDAFPDDLINKKRETQDRNNREMSILTMKNKVDTTKLCPNCPNLSYTVKFFIELAINFTDYPVPFACNSDINKININSDLYPTVSEINLNLPFTKRKIVVKEEIKAGPIVNNVNTLPNINSVPSTTVNQNSAIIQPTVSKESAVATTTSTSPLTVPQTLSTESSTPSVVPTPTATTSPPSTETPSQSTTASQPPTEVPLSQPTEPSSVSTSTTPSIPVSSPSVTPSTASSSESSATPSTSSSESASPTTSSTSSAPTATQPSSSQAATTESSPAPAASTESTPAPTQTKEPTLAPASRMQMRKKRKSRKVLDTKKKQDEESWLPKESLMSLDEIESI